MTEFVPVPPAPAADPVPVPQPPGDTDEIVRRFAALRLSGEAMYVIESALWDYSCGESEAADDYEAQGDQTSADYLRARARIADALCSAVKKAAAAPGVSQ